MNTDYPKLVSWSYYDGRGHLLLVSNPTKEFITEIWAKNAEAENVLKQTNNRILALNREGDKDDPYFFVKKRFGFTCKSLKHGEIRKSMEKDYPALQDRVKSFKGGATTIQPYGEYIWVNMPYTQSIPWVDYEKFANSPKGVAWDSPFFANKSSFDKELIIKILTYKHYTTFDHQLIDDTKAHLEFLRELSFKMPELYNQVVTDNDYAKELTKQITSVGKHALVTTMLPGKVTYKLRLEEVETLWDGSVITGEMKTPQGDTMEFTITPTDKTVVTILEDSTVSSNTVFA